MTEIYDYLRLLWARVGTPHCPNCGKEIQQQTVDQIIDQVMRLPEATRIQVMAPVIKAGEDFPEPDTPVRTTSLSRGMSVTFSGPIALPFRRPRANTLWSKDIWIWEDGDSGAGPICWQMEHITG